MSPSRPARVRRPLPGRRDGPRRPAAAPTGFRRSPGAPGYGDRQYASPAGNDPSGPSGGKAAGPRLGATAPATPTGPDTPGGQRRRPGCVRSDRRAPGPGTVAGSGPALPPCPAPDRTGPHRTAPHRTAPHQQSRTPVAGTPDNRPVNLHRHRHRHRRGVHMRGPALADRPRGEPGRSAREPRRAEHSPARRIRDRAHPRAGRGFRASGPTRRALLPAPITQMRPRTGITLTGFPSPLPRFRSALADALPVGFSPVGSPPPPTLRKVKEIGVRRVEKNPAGRRT
jgi:hypothetical protein